VEEHFEVVVIGAGVVGSGVSLELARRAVKVALLEAEPEPGLAASGTNSGIVHTGFDSTPGELETELILASARLRAEVTVALGIPMLRCGAVLRAGGAARDVIARAGANGVAAHGLDGGNVEIPDESVTDPVAHTLALSAEAVRQGATLLTGHRAVAIDRGPTVRTEAGAAIRCAVVVNCAGLHADDVARLAGDDSFAIFPRKGEFLVFDPPGGAPLERILLPVRTTRTRGVLVFPTIDGRVLAGPTAVDLDDKHDWSVRPEARAEILPRAVSMYPPLEGAEPIAAYAGLRPAGRGINYLIGRSEARSWLVNVAAIRSTGLTASLGIAEHVAGIVASLGVKLSQRVGLIGGELPRAGEPWWRRTAEFRGAAV
jgi:glycerol-3-phosphate dehydrogenase